MRTVRDQARTLSELLIALIGPTVWFAHFSAAYTLEGFVCPLAEQNLGPAEASNVMRWAILALSALALLALALLLICAQRRAVRDASHGRTAQRLGFLHHIQSMLTLLAAIAVLWTTLAVLMVTPCTPVLT